MIDLTSSPFRLGPWRVEPLRHSLEWDPSEGEQSVGNDTARHLTPKTMEVLVCLAARAKAVATRAELLAAVWPETHIGEEVLTRAISDLRSALGDDPRQPRFIETIPKVGYRLIVDVFPLSQSPTGLGGISAARSPGKSPPLGMSSPLPTGPGTAAREAAAARRRPLAVALVTVLALAAGLSLARREPATTPPVPVPVPLPAAPLTTYPGFESYAEISPDGTRFAFARRPTSETAPDIYIMPTAGGEAVQLTADPADDIGPTWSPDGLRIAFMRRKRDECTVLEIAAQGGPQRVLGSCGANVTGDLAWSPSGEWLAFSDREADGDPMGIFLLSTVSGEKSKVVAPDGEHWGDHTPSFSPDGRQLAFVRSVSMNTQDVYRIDLMNLDGGGPVAVTQDNASIRGHAWLPDGSGLVISSRRTGARGLWQVPVDDSAPRWIPLAVGHAWFPTLARQTGQILFEHRILESTLQRRSLTEDPLEQGSEGGAWLPSTHEDLSPSYSPDGSRVAFTSNRSGHFEIWTARPDGTQPRQVTALAGAFNGSPRWAPDGTAVVFDARLDGQADVYRVVLEASTGTEASPVPERLTRNLANDLAPSVSPDGRFVYFGSNRSGRWQIWRHGATDRNADAVQITEEGGYMALPTTDGDHLYLTRYGQPGLFRHSLTTGATRSLAGTEGLYSSGHWTVVGNTVYFLAAVPQDGQQTIQLLRLGAGAEATPEPVADLGRRRLMVGLTLAPNEGSFLFAELTRLEADIWKIDGNGQGPSPSP